MMIIIAFWFFFARTWAGQFVRYFIASSSLTVTVRHVVGGGNDVTRRETVPTRREADKKSLRDFLRTRLTSLRDDTTDETVTSSSWSRLLRAARLYTEPQGDKGTCSWPRNQLNGKPSYNFRYRATVLVLRCFCYFSSHFVRGQHLFV